MYTIKKKEHFIYHLGLNTNDVRGIRAVLLPGDPFRVPAIAREAAMQCGGEIAELAWKREFRSFAAGDILVTSTGIGGPSTAIALEELCMLGLQTFIRIGTTGAIQEFINPGDVIITTGSVRLDGASKHYAPAEYPAVAHYELVNAIVHAAGNLGIPYHAGITASSDTFYPGQERADCFTGYIPRHMKGTMEDFKNLNVLNYEMETATLLTLGSIFKVRCAAVCGVVINRCREKEISAESLALGEANAIKTGVAAIQSC